MYIYMYIYICIYECIYKIKWLGALNPLLISTLTTRFAFVTKGVHLLAEVQNVQIKQLNYGYPPVMTNITMEKHHF